MIATTPVTRFDPPRFAVRVAVLLGLVLLAVSASPDPAVAQAQSETVPKSNTEAVLLPVPPSQLTVRAEETTTKLRGMRDRPAPDEKLEVIKAALPETMERITSLTLKTDPALDQAVSSRTLDDLGRRWGRVKHLLEDWRSHVSRRAELIDRDVETLQEYRQLWELTLEAYSGARGEDPAISMIQKLLDQIEREEARFGKVRAELLKTRVEISHGQDLVADAFDQLNTAKKELRTRLYMLDTPPLWTELANPPPPMDHLAQITSSGSDAIQALKNFYRDRQSWLVLQLIALILLVVVIRALKRRVEQLQLTDPQNEDAVNIISRPYSSALVLSFVCILLFYPNPPRIVEEITTILCFIPLYRILPRKVFRRLGKLLIWLVCLHALDRFTDILAYQSLLKRLLLLVLTTTTAALLIRAIRTKASDHIRNARHIRTAEIVGVFLLSIAFGANVLGNLSLADTITSAVITSAYFALVLYAVYLVIDSVLLIGLNSRPARALRMVRRNGELIHSRVMTVLSFGFKVMWLAFSLYWLSLLPLIVELSRMILTAQARFGDISLSLGGILAFAFTIWAAFFISRIIRFILEEDVLPRMPLPRGVPNAISTSVHYVILLLAFILAIAATGVDLGKFAILAGAFGVGIGFGLQNIVNNFISGLILIAERPIMPGDTVEFGSRIGDVKRIGMRSSTIRLWSGAEVIVPNANLIANEVINWTLSDRKRRLDLPVGVAYGSPVKQVMEILANVAVGHAEVLETPPPKTLFMGFGNSSLDFELRCWTMKFESFRRIKSDLIVDIEAALNESGITIPFPQRDLHIKSVESNAGRTLRGDEPVEEDTPAPVDPDLPRVAKKPQVPRRGKEPEAPPEAEFDGEGGDD